jgi:large-conductance mechanosensitive channel
VARISGFRNTRQQINRFKKETPPAPAAPTPEVALLGEIRDILKEGTAGDPSRS